MEATVNNSNLADDSVTAAKIKDGEVGTAELAADAVTAAKIKNGEVGTAELANNSVTTAKINGTIPDNKIASADTWNAKQEQIVAGSGVSLAADKKTISLDATNITSVSTVTSGKWQADKIDLQYIGDGTLSNSELALLDTAAAATIKNSKAVIYGATGQIVTDKLYPSNDTMQVFQKNSGTSTKGNTLTVYGDLEVANDMACGELTTGGDVDVNGDLASKTLQVEGDVTIGTGTNNSQVDNAKSSTVTVTNKITLKSHASGADKKIHLDTTILDIGNKGTETNATLYGELEVAGDIGCNDLIVGDNLEVGNNVYIEDDLTIGDADDKTSLQTIYGGLTINGPAKDVDIDTKTVDIDASGTVAIDSSAGAINIGA